MTRRTASAPRKLGRPADVDSTETRTRLLAAARAAFAAQGYDATTNRAIAEAAGITAGAIYHYYPSKTDLYVAVYAEVQEMVFDAFQQAADAHNNLLDQFAAVLDAAVELNRTDPSLAGFVVGVAAEAQRHPELRQRVRPLRRRTSTLIHRLVEASVARGELATDVDPQAVEDLLDAVMSGLARFSTSTGDSERHAAAVDALKRFFAGTLVARAAAS
jgi:AcrR family transcriptional regulator